MLLRCWLQCLHPILECFGFIHCFGIWPCYLPVKTLGDSDNGSSNLYSATHVESLDWITALKPWPRPALFIVGILGGLNQWMEMLSVCLSEYEINTWVISTTMFITGQFTVANIWKHPRCLSIDDWRRKCHTHTILFSHKKNEILYLIHTQKIQMEIMMLSEISPFQKDNSMFSLLCLS